MIDFYSDANGLWTTPLDQARGMDDPTTALQIIRGRHHLQGPGALGRCNDRRIRRHSHGDSAYFFFFMERIFFMLFMAFLAFIAFMRRMAIVRVVFCQERQRIF